MEAEYSIRIHIQGQKHQNHSEELGFTKIGARESAIMSNKKSTYVMKRNISIGQKLHNLTVVEIYCKIKTKF